jgi:cytochrome c oxidase subunit 2
VVKYRRGTRAYRAPQASHGSLPLEITWSVIPFILMMISFVWGARLFFQIHNAPDHAMEVLVVGKQWMWKLQHANGKREINTLHVPTGRPVRLTMISEDVIHSFFLPACRIKQDVLPGRYTTQWFQGLNPGEYHLFCAEYCGTAHANMIGRLVVQEPADFAAWLVQENVEAPEIAGQQLFERLQCGTCHGNQAENRAPNLGGVFGSRVPLENGGSVVADMAYLRRSILRPKADVVAGFRPIMPAFESQLSEEQVLQLIAHIRSLGTSSAAESGGASQDKSLQGPAERNPGRSSVRED